MGFDGSDKILLGAFIVPYKEKRARTVELWQAIADDIRSTEKGRISMELYEEVEGDGFLVLDDESVRDNFVAKPSHMEIHKNVMEEELLKHFEVVFWKRLLGVGKTIGGRGEGEGVVTAAFVEVNEGRRERAIELWQAIVDDINATEQGTVAMEVYDKADGDGLLVLYEFADETAKESFNKKPSQVEIVDKERVESVLKNIDIKSCKHVLGSGSGIGEM